MNPDHNVVAQAQPYVFKFSKSMLSQKIAKSFYNFVDGGDVHAELERDDETAENRKGGANFFSLSDASTEKDKIHDGEAVCADDWYDKEGYENWRDYHGTGMKD